MAIDSLNQKRIGFGAGGSIQSLASPRPQIGFGAGSPMQSLASPRSQIGFQAQRMARTAASRAAEPGEPPGVSDESLPADPLGLFDFEDEDETVRADARGGKAKSRKKGGRATELPPEDPGGPATSSVRPVAGGSRVVSPQEAAQTALNTLWGRFIAAGGKVTSGDPLAGRPIPIKADDAARVRAEAEARQFTPEHARMLSDTISILGLDDEYAPMLRRLGYPTEKMKAADARLAARSNERTRMERHNAPPPDYAAWGGKGSYEAAQRLNAFYRANRSRWGELLKTASGGSVTLDDFSVMSREDKQQMVKFIQDNVTTDDKGRVSIGEDLIEGRRGDDGTIRIRTGWGRGNEAVDWDAAGKWTAGFNDRIGRYQKAQAEIRKNAYIGPMKRGGRAFLENGVVTRPQRDPETIDEALHQITEGRISRDDIAGLYSPTRDALLKELEGKIAKRPGLKEKYSDWLDLALGSGGANG